MGQGAVFCALKTAIRRTYSPGQREARAVYPYPARAMPPEYPYAYGLNTLPRPEHLAEPDARART